MGNPDSIGRRLKQLRLKRKMTQTELAEAAKLQQSMISEIENGKRPGHSMSVDAARRFAFALRVGIGEFIGPIGENGDTENRPAA